ncbi:hypothetical protein NAC44_02665 [Allorhizobium sp. BGMRC 0089]|uniref:hypothetical protein n=1 Tax=Allorhizobium sonneratiae TaxID=2934936 RepID=UPI0020343536|nr:hypothetical protein [Allorhizobium sonneratiae]MCM2291230.1 hypothetical protein [Allorhizobium sonneratiae]
MAKATKHFQEKCAAVFRPEMRKTKNPGHFQEKCVAVFRPEMRKTEEWERRSDEIRSKSALIVQAGLFIRLSRSKGHIQRQDRKIVFRKS